MGHDLDARDLLCLDLPKAERVRKGFLAAEGLELWAAGLKALGDPTRLAVALALDAGGSACVCDLAWIVGRDERLISHHARQLKASGIARSGRDGKMVMYELTERGRALLAAVASLEPGRAADACPGGFSRSVDLARSPRPACLPRQASRLAWDRLARRRGGHRARRRAGHDLECLDRLRR